MELTPFDMAVPSVHAEVVTLAPTLPSSSSSSSGELAPFLPPPPPPRAQPVVSPTPIPTPPPPAIIAPKIDLTRTGGAPPGDPPIPAIIDQIIPGEPVMAIPVNPQPNSGFIKGIIGGLTGFAAGGKIGAVVGALSGFTDAGSEPPSGEPPVPGLVGTGGGPCPGLAQVRNPITGQCIDLTALPPGGDPAFVPASSDAFGRAVPGRYGAALEPAVTTRAVRRCPRGSVLGNDGLCYNKPLAKSKRMWNPGAKPLLTGGEMNAIRKAESAANRLQRTRKKIKKAGRALEKAC